MAHAKLKINATNIILLWFAQNTSIRAFKIKMNPELWVACQRVSQGFILPSGAVSVPACRKRDLISFAKAVQQELQLRKQASQEIPAYA